MNIIQSKPYVSGLVIRKTVPLEITGILYSTITPEP